MRLNWHKQDTKWQPLIKATMSRQHFGKLLLNKYCRASKKEAKFMIPTLSPLLRIITHPLIVTNSYST